MSASTQTSTATPDAEQAGLLGKFGLNGELFAAQALNFVIILLVMWRWVYRPLMRKMDDRAKRISQGLEFSKEADERLKNARAESERVINAARAEARTILEQTTVKAETLRREKMTQAKAEIEKVIAEAKEQIKSERAAAYVTLKQDLAQLVALATAKVAAEMDEKAQRALIREAIKEIEKV